MIYLPQLYKMKERIEKYGETAEQYEFLNLLTVQSLVDIAIQAAEIEGHIEEHQESLEKLAQIVDDTIGKE